MKKQFFIYLIMIFLTGCTFQWNGTSIDGLANFIDGKPNIKCESEPWSMTISIERPDNFDLSKFLGGRDEPKGDGSKPQPPQPPQPPKLPTGTVPNAANAAIFNSSVIAYNEYLTMLKAYYDKEIKITEALAALADKIGCAK